MPISGSTDEDKPSSLIRKGGFGSLMWMRPTEPMGHWVNNSFRSILWLVGEGLEKVFGDQAYNGVFARELARWSIDFEKSSWPESAQGFVLVAKR